MSHAQRPALVLGPGEGRSIDLGKFAMVGYFDGLSASIATGGPDPARLDEIALRHGMEVVGPVPQGYL